MRGRAKARPYNIGVWRSLVAEMGLADGGGEGADVGDAKLRQQNRERHACENGEMQRGARGGAECFWRKRTGGAALTRCGGNSSRCAERRGGAQDGADIAGILHSSEHDEKRRTRFGGNQEKFIERNDARLDQSGDALRMLGVGETLEKTIGGSQDREGDFGRIDERSESLMVALASFAEEHRLDAAARAQSFFDQADTFDTDETGLGGQAAAQSDAECPEPAIVAAGEHRVRARGPSQLGGFSRRSHTTEGSKFARKDANFKCFSEEGCARMMAEPLRGVRVYGSVPRSK